MLYNNVRAMQHIQGHIDASKQQHIDLSDSTQCKYCYKQFDTSFEMQTHVEKVHLSNKVLMCRICEKDFGTARELMHHMGTSHHANEMPYLCQLCNFRSSMYSDVVDHFKKKHDSSHHLLCLYCLRTFQVKFCSQGWGQTQTFYGHLLKHMSKSSTKRCITCRLTFFNITDVKNHKRLCHGWNQKEDPQKSSQSSKQDSFQRGRKKGTSLKSLNAPSISKIQDYSDVIFPSEVNTAKCVECKLSMSSMDHYKKFIHCSMCRFATSCSVAYANHMMGFHSGQMSSLNLNIPWERPMKELMYCNCGFPSKYGNKIANHLVFCTKTTCCSSKPRLLTLEGSDEKKEDGKKEDSLLGMLGMVQKKSVTTRVRTNQDKKEQQKKVPGPQSKKTVKMGKRKPGPKSKTTDIVDWKTDTPESKYSKIEQIDDVIVLDEERDKEDKDIVIVETTPTKLKALHDDTSSSKTDRVVGEVKDVQTEMESKIVTEVKEDMKIEDKINLQKTEDNIEDELKMESESQVVNAVKEGLNKESNSDEMFELEASGCKIEMPETIDISKNKTFNENLENTFDVSSAAKDSENNTFAGLEIVDSCNQNSSFTGLVENQKEAMDERTMDPVNGSGPMEKHFESGQENIVEPQQLPQKFEHEMEVEEHDEQEMNIIQNNVSETDLNPDNTENFDINAMEVETDNHNLNERPSVHDDHKMEFTCAEETKNVNLEEPKVDCKNLEVQTVKEGIATEVLQECKQAKEQCKSNSVTIKDQKQTADKLESDLLQDKAHSSNQILDTIGDQLEESKEKERTKHHSGECHRERQTSSVGQRDILQCKDGLKRHNPSEQGVASDHSTNKLDSRDHLLPVASQSEDKSRQKQEYKPHYDSKGRHNDKSSSYHSSQRADSYHSGRQSYDSRGYDRNRDLSLSNRDYRQDNRQGYGHQDNRDQGYGGSRGHQGSYNDYRGNLDNRSRGNYRGGQGYGNRGGYNQQKYRDSYGGGYY